jgi:hypothetical protein
LQDPFNERPVTTKLPANAGEKSCHPYDRAPAFFKRNLEIGTKADELEKLAELLSDL